MDASTLIQTQPDTLTARTLIHTNLSLVGWKNKRCELVQVSLGDKVLQETFTLPRGQAEFFAAPRKRNRRKNSGVGDV